MRTVNIPGGTAQFRTKEDRRARDTKLVKAAAIAAQSALEKLGPDVEVKPGETEEDAAKRVGEMLRQKQIVFTTQEAISLLNLYEAMIVANLSSWTLDRPIPNIDTIGDLPDELYESLEAAAKTEAMTLGSEINTAPNPDQSSPTGPSSASNGDLKAESSQEANSPLPITNSTSDTEASLTEKSIPV